MYTSYYSNPHIFEIPTPRQYVSISYSIMPWINTKFAGHNLIHFKELAPSWKLISGYKQGHINKFEYIAEYNMYLSKLNVNTIISQLDEGAVLMCYEKPTDFCHRHLVSDWIKTKTGIDIIEFGSQSSIDLSDEWIF